MVERTEEKKAKEEQEQKVQVEEVDINLSLINEKLNFLINLARKSD